MLGVTAGGGVYSKQFSVKQFSVKQFSVKHFFVKQFSVKQISVSFHEVLHQARRGRVSKFK
jgi:hypothetical protein